MDRIEINPAICSGKPVICGTRIMVSNILGMVAGGYAIDRILTAYPVRWTPSVGQNFVRS